MSGYLILILCVVPAAFLLFLALALRKGGRVAAAAAVSFPVCVVFGVVFAKLFYVLLMEAGRIAEWGEWDALFSLKPGTFCFTGGAVGVWLGLLLSARMTGCRPAGKVLDLFTVPGTLLIAGLRMAEVELGSLGAGRFVGPEEGFPASLFTITNEFGEAHVAVFAWEAAAAVLIGVLSLAGKENRPGARFETAVFRLCVCQILLENLRSRPLSWGFVRVEQLLCAVILTALMLAACLRNTKKQGAVRFLPVFGLLACFAAIVGVEFLRQRSPSRFMGETGGFLLMGFVLGLILLLYRSATGGLRRPARNR